MEIAAAAQARGETGTKASGAVERKGRKRRRGGQGQGQVPVAVTGSGPRQVQLLRRGPGLAHRGRPSREDQDACWYLAQRGRHVVSIRPPRRASAGPTRKLMVTATTMPVLSPNPRAAHTWRSPVGQSASAADLIDAVRSPPHGLCLLGCPENIWASFYSSLPLSVGAHRIRRQ